MHWRSLSPSIHPPFTLETERASGVGDFLVHAQLSAASARARSFHLSLAKVKIWQRCQIRQPCVVKYGNVAEFDNLQHAWLSFPYSATFHLSSPIERREMKPLSTYNKYSVPRRLSSLTSVFLCLLSTHCTKTKTNTRTPHMSQLTKSTQPVLQTTQRRGDMCTRRSHNLSDSL